MSTIHDHGSGDPGTTGDDTGYTAIQATPEFAQLRARFRRFVFPMTALFLVWYFLYVLLSTYATDFMSTRVFGNVNLGLLLGLAQFATTFLITQLYVRHATKSTDPISDEMRTRLEAHQFADPSHRGESTRG